MTTRTTDAIAQELDAARTKLAELKAENDSHAKMVEELTEKRRSLLSAGKKAEARKLRDTILDHEDEIDATATLGARIGTEVQRLESEHAEAVRADLMAKAAAASEALSAEDARMTAALSDLGAIAARHREVRAEYDNSQRATGQPVSSLDSTELLCLAHLVRVGAIDSRSVYQPLTLLRSYIEPTEDAASRRAIQAEASREAAIRERPEILKHELFILDQKLAKCSAGQEGQERRARLTAERGLVSRQLDALVAPGEGVELEAVNA
jgi:hypothetical protein